MDDLLKQLEEAKIVNEIANMDDDVTLSAELAAVFLRSSPSKLATLRQEGGGPVYMQYPNQGSKARNQPVHYKLKALKDWQKGREVRTTMDAAVSRGMAFVDLRQEVPFWVVGKGADSRILTPSYTASTAECKENLNNPLVYTVWMRWGDALIRRWNSTAQKQFFMEKFAAAAISS